MLKVIEEKKNRIVFDLEGETRTLANALKQELEQDSHVKNTGYNVSHPLIHTPRFVIETDGEDPKKILKDSVKRLRKEVQKLKDQAKELK
ncbi:DNA-directed RNA polymerase subunit L [Candidatus Woesearchaeota archaeon]|nr:DNA-directed RNA polymerase subunit L [Candidatus Woesearchaeota archaeon]